MLIKVNFFNNFHVSSNLKYWTIFFWCVVTSSYWFSCALCFNNTYNEASREDTTLFLNTNRVCVCVCATVITTSDYQKVYTTTHIHIYTIFHLFNTLFSNMNVCVLIFPNINNNNSEYTIQLYNHRVRDFIQLNGEKLSDIA